MHFIILALIFFPMLFNVVILLSLLVFFVRSNILHMILTISCQMD